MTQSTTELSRWRLSPLLQVVAAALSVGVACLPPALLANGARQIDQPAATRSAAPKSASKSNALLRVSSYAKEKDVVAILILKGTKPEKFTAEQLSEGYKALLSAPLKVDRAETFIEPGGDYTQVLFFVEDQMYGPYDAKQAISALPGVADHFIVMVKPRLAEPSKKKK